MSVRRTDIGLPSVTPDQCVPRGSRQVLPYSGRRAGGSGACQVTSMWLAGDWPHAAPSTAASRSAGKRRNPGKPPSNGSRCPRSQRTLNPASSDSGSSKRPCPNSMLRPGPFFVTPSPCGLFPAPLLAQPQLRGLLPPRPSTGEPNECLQVRRLPLCSTIGTSGRATRRGSPLPRCRRPGPWLPLGSRCSRPPRSARTAARTRRTAESPPRR